LGKVSREVDRYFTTAVFTGPIIATEIYDTGSTHDQITDRESIGRIVRVVHAQIPTCYAKSPADGTGSRKVGYRSAGIGIRQIRIGHRRDRLLGATIKNYRATATQRPQRWVSRISDGQRGISRYVDRRGAGKICRDLKIGDEGTISYLDIRAGAGHRPVCGNSRGCVIKNYEHLVIGSKAGGRRAGTIGAGAPRGEQVQGSRGF
jgi:hypothetical protein